jgi:hypothetical protein
LKFQWTVGFGYHKINVPKLIVDFKQPFSYCQPAPESCFCWTRCPWMISRRSKPECPNVNQCFFAIPDLNS